MKKQLKKWKKKLRKCKRKKRKGNNKVKTNTGAKKTAKQCLACCVKAVMLNVVAADFDLDSFSEEQRKQRETTFETVLNEKVESKFSQLTSAGLVEESSEDLENEDLDELDEDDEDDEDEIEDEEDEEEDLEEDEEISDEDSLDAKKKKKKTKKNKKKKKKTKKNKSGKNRKAAQKACRKQFGMTFAFDLASVKDNITEEYAREQLAFHHLDFDALEANDEDDEDEDDEDEDEDDDLAELFEEDAIKKAKAKKVAKKCCPGRVTFSSFEHQYVKQH